MQVILNLVNNAIKFTEHGEIVILVEMIKERLDLSGNKTVELRFSLSDTGIGVAANKLDLIFDKFTQADSSTTRKYGGTGLGLHISKRLVELLGGTIWLESKPGEGSTFFFTAIFAKGTSAIAAPARKETQTGEPLTAEVRPLQILLVEDNKDNRLLLLTFLKKTPHTVEIAVNGAEAVDKFRSGRYDLVFMDIQMPVMDGYTASAKIREWESETGAQPTPLVALTAHAMKEDELKSLEAGCDSHLTKPIKKGVLLEVIRRYASVEEDV
jgi:CheY-like chemotaxis protein